MELRPYQKDAVEAAKAWITHCIDPCLIEMATGCHERGQGIMMYDGSIKPVEYIEVGDILMGRNSQPRTVQNLCRGFGDMYKISPIKGKPFIVNGDHILSLVSTNTGKKSKNSTTGNEYVNITVNDYIKMGKTWKHIHKLYRDKVVSFGHEKNDLPIPPYILGCLLGDGSIYNVAISITTMDEEIVKEWNDYLSSIGCRSRKDTKENNKASTYYARFHDPLNLDKRFSKGKSMLPMLLKKIGVYGKKSSDKHVPDLYKTSSVSNRLEIIAGLLDTDGHMDHNGFDFISKSEQLADDLVFLCRSVGLAAYCVPCEKTCQVEGFVGNYFRVSISGDCFMIPNRVERQKCGQRQQKKRVSVTGFSVEYIGKNDYFGFELDGDKLYLMDDFTVTHNSGKSHVVAALAHYINTHYKKRVLCIAPSSELVSQNHKKYLLTKNPASIYCASISKSVAHDVVFGSPVSVLNALNKFSKGDFGAVIVDEAHGLTPTVKKIIDGLRTTQPRLRVIGMTATPYRLNTGYIYGHTPDGKVVEETIDPYFHTLIYQIQARELIEMGYLSPIHADPAHAEGYDTSGLVLNRMGKYDAQDVERAFEGHGRKTSAIISDVVEHSIPRRGVIIYASTVAHAHECMASLPPHLSAVVTGDTKKADRERILREFLAQKLKYLVNVDVYTTGFDAPHVDVIAILRATESPGLLQQIIGRGLRLSPGKQDCLLLDYAENVSRHFPDGDIFAPEVKARAPSSGEPVSILCPVCDGENLVSMRKNEDGFGYDEYGYFLDLAGNRIETEYGPMPSHYGRRCTNEQINRDGTHERCAHRWSPKICPECEHENDIAARRCESCRAELVNPNDKLLIEYKKIKKSPSVPTSDKVLSWRPQKWVSQKGNESLRVDWVTECAKFSVWYQDKASASQAQQAWADLSRAVYRGRLAPDVDTFMKHIEKAIMPSTISAYRPQGTEFWRVKSYNDPLFEEPKS